VADAGTPLPEDALRAAAQFFQDSYEVLTGTGAHAEHEQRQIGRCVFCTCGKRVQGRLKRRG
jgi:hypothetical protein